MFAEIPDAMKPLANLSVIRWGFEGCMAAEMEGLEFAVDATAMPKGIQMPPPGLGEVLRSFALRVLDPAHTNTARETAFAEPYCLKRGDQVLEGLGIDPNHGVRRSVAMALKIFAANSAVAFAAMRAQGREDGFKVQMLEECSEPLHAGEGDGGDESAATSDGHAKDVDRGARTAPAAPDIDSGSEERGAFGASALSEEPGTAPETTPETTPEKSAAAPEDTTPGGTRIYPMNLHFSPLALENSSLESAEVVAN